MTSTIAALPPRTATGPRTALQPSSVADACPGRAFLTRYALTLTGLLAGLALLPAWTLAPATPWGDAHPWATAAGATTGWALGAAAWLRRRGWRPAAAHAVAWTAPVVVLAPLTGPGWLSPAGLVLWAPITTVLAAALMTAVQPMAAPAPAPCLRRRRRRRLIMREPSGPVAVVIRPVCPRTDECLAGELLAVQHAAYAVEAALIGDGRIPPLQENCADLRRAPLSWLGAFLDERLVGAVAWSAEPEVLDLARLVVAPTAHRRGVGSALVRRVLDHAGRRPTVVATGRDNRPARAFYERLGFTATGQHQVLPGLWITHYRHAPRASDASPGTPPALR